MSRFLVLSLVAGILGAIIADRKGRDWLTWSVACLLFPFAIIILIGLPVVPKQGITKRCPKCGSIMGARESACPRCGSDSPIEMVECKECGVFVPPGEKCPSCGKRQ